MFALIKSLWRKGHKAMDIVLHVGAHRCATTTFQAYLDQNRDQLRRNDIAVWTPQDTRMGLFDGMICPPGRDDHAAIADLRDAVGQLRAGQLLISEENMIGSPRNNLQHGGLYPTAQLRLARFAKALEGRVQRVGLAIRSYESYWVSAMTFAAMRGGDLPTRAQCAALAVQPRNWTRIARDIRTVFPNAALQVWLFETFANRPRRQFNLLSGRQDITHLLDQTPAWKNNSRNTAQLRRRLRAHGRTADAALLPKGNQAWQPFTPLEQQHMAAQYRDDIAYFRSGTDPLIHFTENAAIKVLRRKTQQATLAFDTGETDDRHAKMG